MSTTEDRNALAALLVELGSSFEMLRMPSESLRATTLLSTINEDRPVKVVVVGEFNSGKSTLVNALLRWNVLPTGIIPTTATISVLSHAMEHAIRILRTDGSVQNLAYSSDILQHLSARYGQHADIREVRIEGPEVAADLVVIDTPGVNDINQTRSEIVYQMIPEADVVIFLMDVQQPLKRSEVDFLRDRILGSSMVRTIFVLNHIDRISSAIDVSTAVAYVRKQLAEIYGTVADGVERSGCGHLASQLRRYAVDILVYTISAKEMLRFPKAGQDQVGDPMDLRATLLGYAAPEAKM